MSRRLALSSAFVPPAEKHYLANYRKRSDDDLYTGGSSSVAIPKRVNKNRGKGLVETNLI
jgi:hypothetical protein